MNPSPNIDYFRDDLTCHRRDGRARSSLIVPILVTFTLLIGFVLAAVAVSERLASF